PFEFDIPEEDAPESNVTAPDYEAPESNVTTPDYEAPESNVTTPDYEAPESNVTTPDYEAPESNVTTPDYEAPESNVTTPDYEAPESNVTTPDYEAPESNVTTPDYEAPESNVTTPDYEAPESNVTTPDYEAPESNVTTPDYEAPESNVTTPDYEAPESNVTTPDYEAPESNVTTPDYEAPESNVTTPDYEAPESNVTTPDYEAPESNVTTPDYEAPESNVTTPDYDAPEENATTPFGGFGAPPADNGEDDLSGGAIAAIVICSIVLVGVVAGFLVFRKRSRLVYRIVDHLSTACPDLRRELEADHLLNHFFCVSFTAAPDTKAMLEEKKSTQQPFYPAPLFRPQLSPFARINRETERVPGGYMCLACHHTHVFIWGSLSSGVAAAFAKGTAGPYQTDEAARTALSRHRNSNAHRVSLWVVRYGAFVIVGYLTVAAAAIAFRVVPANFRSDAHPQAGNTFEVSLKAELAETPYLSEERLQRFFNLHVPMFIRRSRDWHSADAKKGKDNLAAKRKELLGVFGKERRAQQFQQWYPVLRMLRNISLASQHQEPTVLHLQFRLSRARMAIEGMTDGNENKRRLAKVAKALEAVEEKIKEG
ncbi:Cysteine-rich, partial [Diplonema papillatum]